MTRINVPHSESEFAKDHPELIQMMDNGGLIVNELSDSIAHSAIHSAEKIVLYQSLLNTSAIIRGKKDFSEALCDTLSCTVSATIKSTARGVAVRGIQIATKDISNEFISSIIQSHGLYAITNAVLDMRKATGKYIKGQIGEDELKEAYGTSALKSTATFYCGSVGQILIPIPIVGAMAGSIVGYTTASMLVEAGILGAGPRNIVEQSRKRLEQVEKECAKSRKELKKYKERCLSISQYFDREYRNVLIPQLNDIEKSLDKHAHDDVINQLELFNHSFSKKIQFQTYEEFNRFVADSKSKLIL